MEPQHTFTLRRILAEQVQKIRIQQNQSLTTLSSGTGLALERLKSIESAAHDASLDDLTRLSIGLSTRPGRLIQPSEDLQEMDELEPVVLVQSYFVSMLERSLPNNINSIINYLDRCGVTFIHDE